MDRWIMYMYDWLYRSVLLCNHLIVAGYKHLTGKTRELKIPKVNKHSVTTHTSHFGVVGHSDATFVVVCLHGNLSSTSGTMPEGIQQRIGLQFCSI